MVTKCYGIIFLIGLQINLLKKGSKK